MEGKYPRVFHHYTIFLKPTMWCVIIPSKYLINISKDSRCLLEIKSIHSLFLRLASNNIQVNMTFFSYEIHYESSWLIKCKLDYWIPWENVTPFFKRTPKFWLVSLFVSSMEELDLMWYGIIIINHCYEKCYLTTRRSTLSSLGYLFHLSGQWQSSSYSIYIY